MTASSQEQKLETHGVNSIGETVPLHSTNITDKHWELGLAITPIDVASTYQGDVTGGVYVAKNLPNGVTIDPNTGVISGTPTEYVSDKARAGVRFARSGGSVIKTNAFKTYRGPLPGGIDRDKVFIVYNTSVADSEVIADYYIAKRHLNPSNKIGFAFGTGSSWNATTGDPMVDVMEPLAAFTEGAHAIICSAFTPYRAVVYETVPGTRSNTVGFSNLMGICGLVANDMGEIPDISLSSKSMYPYYASTAAGQPGILPYTPNTRAYISGTGGSNYYQWTRRITNYLGNPYWAFHGRLGFPTLQTGPAETVAEVQRIIDDAVANEQTHASAISSGRVTHFGAHDRAVPWMTGYETALASNQFEALSLPLKRYKLNYNASYNLPYVVDYLGTDMAGTTGNTCITGTGVLSPTENLWGHLDQALCNVDVYPVGEPLHWSASFTFMPGAWGAYPTSVGVKPATSMIINGGCAGIGCVAEPLADRVTPPNDFAREILTGVTMAEAMMFTNHHGPAHKICIGDPLYAPFGREWGRE